MYTYAYLVGIKPSIQNTYHFFWIFNLWKSFYVLENENKVTKI